MFQIRFPRRKVLLGFGASIAAAPWLHKLRADEVQLPSNAVKFRPEIEPLVRLLEETSRAELFRVVASKIKSGTSYSDLLAATLLAGIRNVQPRPNVGFKFHCVMVIHAAHQATMAAKDEHRWFPLFWSMDYFKRCQDQDREEGDWTMQASSSSNISTSNALKELAQAMDAWDVEKADAAATAAVSVATSSQLLDLFARYGARDFRNIGHKAIWVAGAFRTLEVIGWQHAEPVMRSLTYALLNYSGEPNPSTSDLSADRVGKANWELVQGITKANVSIESDRGVVQDWILAARRESPESLGKLTLSALQQDATTQSIWDAISCSAAELVMRQPAIVPLHAITSTNAIRFLHRSVSDNTLRHWLMLQNASFIGHFRESAISRGKLSDDDILSMESSDEEVKDPSIIFEQLASDRSAVSSSILSYLKQGGTPEELQQVARELVLLKGTDSHDYKYSSAIFEDYQYCSLDWRSRLLAASGHLLTSSKSKDNGLAQRIEEAFS